MSKVNVTRKELLAVFSVLESVKDAKTNIRVAYAISKNRRLILPEVEAIQEAAGKVSDTLKEYEKARIALCQEYCKKDERGNPVIDNGNFTFAPEDISKFQVAFEELRKSSPEALKDAQESDEQVQKLLDESIEIEFLPIKLDILPDELFSVAQIDVLVKNSIIEE